MYMHVLPCSRLHVLAQVLPRLRMRVSVWMRMRVQLCESYERGVVGASDIWVKLRDTSMYRMWSSRSVLWTSVMSPRRRLSHNGFQAEKDALDL